MIIILARVIILPFSGKLDSHKHLLITSIKIFVYADTYICSKHVRLRTLLKVLIAWIV